MKNSTRAIALILSIICVFTLFGCRKRKTEDESEQHYYILEGHWVEKDAPAETGAMVMFKYIDGQNIVVIIDNTLEKTSISANYYVLNNYLKLHSPYEDEMEMLGGIDEYANIRFELSNNYFDLELEYAKKVVKFEKFNYDLSTPTTPAK